MYVSDFFVYIKSVVLQVELYCCFFSSFSHPVDINLGLELTSYTIAENGGEVVICIRVERITTSCAIDSEFPASVNLSTTDGSAGIKLTVEYTNSFTISY